MLELLENLVAFLCGSVLTLLLVVAGVLAWVYSQSRPVKDDSSTKDSPYIRPQLPESLLSMLSEDEGGVQVREETCHWFNLIVAFVWQELRDSAITKRFVMKKVSKEFAELMFTRTEGRMIEQLTVRDYFLGTSLPTIQTAKVVKVEGYTAEHPEIQELELVLDVEYTGSCQMAIDADLVFDKAAYIAVELNRLKGRGRLRFSRNNGTHWSFAFMEDPLLEMKVSSHFEGRGYPQLSSIIESQIRKWVKRKHTLPAHKIRYKPFFRKFKPQNQLLEVYVHDKKLTVGKLTVSLLECSRLSQVEGARSVYCTLSVGQMPWQPMVHLWKTQWPEHEFVVCRGAEETIGIIYKLISTNEQESDLVVVSKVISPSAAYTAGVKKGDVLTRVNNVKVTSVKQARRLIKKFKDTGSVLITVQRPPTHFISHMFQSLSPSGRSTSLGTGSSNTTDVTVGADADIPLILDSPTTTAGETTPILVATAAEPSAHGQSVPRQRAHTGVSPSLQGQRSHTGVLGPSPQNQAVWRQRSHTGVTSSRLAESIQPIRSSLTPISSEDERDTRFRSRTSGRVESDTVSLFGVMGERGGGGGGGEGGREDYVSVRHPLTQSTVEESRVGSRSLNRASPPSSIPSPPSSHSPQPAPPSSGDLVDLGSMAGVMEEVWPSENRGQGRRSGEEAVDQKQSKEVQACRNPVWSQKFRFNVAEHHCYLNVCVWVRLQEGRGNLLLGHVTIPLMDIAMECLHTRSSTHQQRYVLTEAQPARPSASRAAVQATSTVTSSSVKKKTNTCDVDKTFAGDVLLKFRHAPRVPDSADNVSQSSPQQVPDEQSVDRHPSVPSQDELPSNHNFVMGEESGITRCDICRKTIWTLKFSHMYQCLNCGLKCHKKCMEYCMKEVKCRRRDSSSHTGDTDVPDPVQSPATNDTNGRGNTSAESNTESSCHRGLDQLDQRRRSESFEMVEGPDGIDDGSGYSTADELEVDHVGGVMDEGLVMEEGCGQEMGVAGESHVTEEVVDGGGDESSSDVERLKWSSHIPPDERETAINKRLSDLQSEINRIHELIITAHESMREPHTSEATKRSLGREIERYEEKMAPLKLLMNEMMSELAQCLSQQDNN